VQIEEDREEAEAQGLSHQGFTREDGSGFVYLDSDKDRRGIFEIPASAQKVRTGIGRLPP